jgi:hypothetical protein
MAAAMAVVGIIKVMARSTGGDGYSGSSAVVTLFYSSNTSRSSTTTTSVTVASFVCIMYLFVGASHAETRLMLQPEAKISSFCPGSVLGPTGLWTLG